MATAESGLLTAAEVAGQLGVSAETVRRWVRGGQLAAVRMPSGRLRIRQSDVDAMFAKVAESGQETRPGAAEVLPPGQVIDGDGVSHLDSPNPEVVAQQTRTGPTVSHR